MKSRCVGVGESLMIAPIAPNANETVVIQYATRLVRCESDIGGLSEREVFSRGAILNDPPFALNGRMDDWSVGVLYAGEYASEGGRWLDRREAPACVAEHHTQV